MPGLICCLRNETTVATPPAILTGTDAGCRTLDIAGANSSALIGCVPRAGQAAEGFLHQGPDLTVAFYGHCLAETQSGFLGARQIHDLFAAEGPDAVNLLDGCFVVFVYRPASDEFWVCSDRKGAVPMFWQNGDAGIVFGHRLDQLPKPPSVDNLDPAGLVTFLTAGYCLGETTLFRSTRFMPPSSRLHCDLQKMQIKSERYWDLAFAPDHRASKSSLMHDINQAMITSVMELSPPESPAGLFLSGGWDSRGMVAGFLGGGALPTVAITQGLTDQLAGSDAGMARRIAERFKIPYRFYERRPENTLRNFRDGILHSELINDSTPDIYGQHRFPPELFEGIKGIYKGQMHWGLDELATSRDDVLLTFGLSVQVPPYVREVLAPILADDAQALYDAELDKILDACPSDSWNDKKDYFVVRGALLRFTFGVDRSDEDAIEVRRPFLSRRILELMGTVPERYRIRKNLYQETLARYYPSLFFMGRDHRSSNTDYYSILAENVRGIGLERLEAGDDLGGTIRPDAARELLEAFRPKPFAYADPSLKSRLRFALQDRLGPWIYRTSWYRERSGARPSGTPFVSPARIAFRLFLLLDYLHRAGDRV